MNSSMGIPAMPAGLRAERFFTWSMGKTGTARQEENFGLNCREPKKKGLHKQPLVRTPDIPGKI